MTDIYSVHPTQVSCCRGGELWKLNSEHGAIFLLEFGPWEQSDLSVHIVITTVEDTSY